MSETNENTAAFHEIYLTVLRAKMIQVRDTDPPMSIIILNQIIDELTAKLDALLADASQHSGYEIGSGR